MSRPAAVSGMFYPGTAAACRAAIEDCLAEPVDPPVPSGVVVGGIVPHAGWAYSGATAALTFRAIGDPPPRCFLFFGAVHQAGVGRPALSPDDEWETPLGPVRVDRDLAARLLAALGDELEESARAHAAEHSLEVQVPFVAHLYPGAAILPLAVPPTPEAVDLGARIGRALVEVPERVVVLGSTDLTHYGSRFYGFTPKGVGADAHRWSKEVNDRAFLDHLLQLDGAGALEAARDRRSACGGGAAAATVTAARALGADRAELLAHTTSHEVRPDPAGPTDFVGYASLVFTRS